MRCESVKANCCLFISPSGRQKTAQLKVYPYTYSTKAAIYAVLYASDFGLARLGLPGPVVQREIGDNHGLIFNRSLFILVCSVY